MKKMWIIGDSFATNMSAESWITRISENYAVTNLSKNGISEYRIYRIFLENVDYFSKNDTVIFCHTNPNRIYLPDRTPYPTRTKDSHPECDLVLGDVGRHGLFWRIISYNFIKYFYDEDYYNTQYDLMVNEMNRIVKDKGCHVIHISGFVSRDPIIGIKDIFDACRGTINHLNEDGNFLVAKRISRLL
jgi:hypothetical protein